MRKYNKLGSCQKVEVGARASDVQWVIPSKQVPEDKYQKTSTRRQALRGVPDQQASKSPRKTRKDQDRDQDQDQDQALADRRRQ